MSKIIELNETLNNLINQFENQIAHTDGIEAKRKLERERNMEIVNCVLAANPAQPEQQHMAVAAAYHDSVHSGMSADAVQIAADKMCSCDVQLDANDTTIRTILIMIANLAARLQEHKDSLYNDGHTGGGG